MSRPENTTATLACGLAGEVVRTFGEVRLRVFGTSMVPSILPGDLISIQRAWVSEISPGEIVLYSREGRLFAHRVVARAGDHNNPRLITRGDRLSHNDPSVSSSELLGRVTSVQCGDGRNHRQVHPTARLNAWEQTVVRVLQTSDRTTYLYLRLAKLWGSILGRTFRSDRKVAPGEGLLSPQGSGAKARTHKLNESVVARLQTQNAEGAVECQV